MTQQEFLASIASTAPTIADAQRRVIEKRYAASCEGMKPLYSRYLSESLRSRLTVLAEATPLERVALDEELDLLKDTVLGEATLYDQACQVYEAAAATGDKKLVDEALHARIAAGQHLRAALDRVGDMCERIVRMRNAGRESLPIHAVNMLVMQVTRIAQDVLPEEFVGTFVERLTNDVRLGDDAAQRGTLMTPDQDAREMDATIPMYAPRPEVTEESA